MSVEDAFKEDLKKIMQYKQLSRRQMSEIIGCSQAQISEVLSGKASFSKEKIFAIITLLNERK
jgi:predicted XRE-type DNA-binding protein